jgi:hypothetical protein
MAAEMVRPLRRWRIDLLGGRTRKEGNFLSIFHSLQMIVIIILGCCCCSFPGRDFYQKTKGGMGKPCLL